MESSLECYKYDDEFELNLFLWNSISHLSRNYISLSVFTKWQRHSRRIPFYSYFHYFDVYKWDVNCEMSRKRERKGKGKFDFESSNF